ncbi:MAG: MotA/TolQ/ExbB proton channel family protein [Planctomycetaceae bacterium]
MEPETENVTPDILTRNKMMDFIVEILSLISAALLYPVLLLLLTLMIWSLVELGGFLRELKERWGSQEQHQFQDVTQDSVMLSEKKQAGFVAIFAEVGSQYRESPMQLQQLQTDLEIDAAGRLARMSFGIRVGPILGLMGTLIPLSPALIGLSTGKIDQLAQNLVVAFSTTVMGLFVAGLCYGIWLMRRQWYARDLARIEHLSSMLTSSSNQEHMNGADITNSHSCASTLAQSAG